MSKELDKFKKTYKPLGKQVEDTQQEYKKHCTNREHHKQMLLESAKQIGRDVQEAKNEGATGTSLKDFASDKRVLSTMKTAMTAMAALSKEDARLKNIMKSAAAVQKKVLDLEKNLSNEIKGRKKKKDRKVLARDSKSLPDMEKLLKEVVSSRQAVKDEVIDVEGHAKWTSAEEKKNFDNWVKQEIGRTKSDRKTRDNKETDTQAFNIRNVQKHAAQAKQLVTVARDKCAEAEKHFKNRKPVDADKCIENAHKALAALKKLHVPYQRGMKKMNKYDVMGMKQTKDGKFILGAIEFMENGIVGLTKLIKKTSRATM